MMTIPTRQERTLLPLTIRMSPLLSSMYHPLVKKLGFSVVDEVVTVGASFHEIPPKTRGDLAGVSGSLLPAVSSRTNGLITSGIGATVDDATTDQTSSTSGLIFSGLTDVTIVSVTCVIVPDAVVDSGMTTT